MKQSLKQKAIHLRKQGYSYKHILKEVSVSKSTLSCWLSDIKYKPNKHTLEGISSARTKAMFTILNNKISSIDRAEKEAKSYLGTVTKRDLFMLGLGVYIGEGTKTQNLVRIVNSDPRIIKLMIRWFKDICGLENSNLKLRLHLYPDIDEDLAFRYWKKKLGLKEVVLQKSCIDDRKGKSRTAEGKLPFGTAHLSVVSNGQKNFGVHLFRKICSWMNDVLV